MRLETDLGKIYCKWSDDQTTLLKMRLVELRKNEDESISYIFRFLDDAYQIYSKEDDPVGEVSYNKDSYNHLRTEWTVLKSDGLISVSNIVAAENECRKIRDVIAIFFPNTKETSYPDDHQPYVIARQGLNNPFNLADDTVGVSVSLETLPTDYTLGDFMDNTGVLSSKMCHVYKVDTAHNIGYLLQNDLSTEILEDLYEHQYNYMKNTIMNLEDQIRDKKIDLNCLCGYNKNLTDFFKNSGFMQDVLYTMGIVPVDFKLEKNVPLSDDNKLFLSIMGGGLKICKAVPLRFDYDIDMSRIRMKYFLVLDCTNTLWIVPYTESPEEVSAIDLYNFNNERTIEIQKRLIKCFNGDKYKQNT